MPIWNTVSRKIKDAKLKNVDPEDRRYHPQLFLHPMSKWHLYGEFKNGVNTGGAIQYVWLFGIIGVFVLILACINFMNLSTARSQKRAREVGIRKAVGSLRGQLIGQFYMESILVAFLAFGFALILTELMLPLFNEVADKNMHILWTSPTVLDGLPVVYSNHRTDRRKLSGTLFIFFPSGKSFKRNIPGGKICSDPKKSIGGFTIHRFRCFNYRNHCGIPSDTICEEPPDRI